MKKIDRRIQKTKKEIRNAFIELIQTKEYKSITITKLASIANIDRKTFYLHYDSIDDVLKEFESEAADKVHILLKNTRPFDIEKFFQGLTKIMNENISFYRHISTFETSYAFFLEQCKDILKNSIKESFYVNSGLTVEIFEIYTEYIASGIIGIYTNWLSTNSKVNLDELTNIAVDAVKNGWNRILQNPL
ncbi:TetR family transcriptional regulator C-terminal domain-containing protein [Clostridium sp. SHJSY1]|uniref:TetR/AcrR family transcriptional regulator n=1 Tax=Clostridium sp. SHJSY1 TaxID=2942483 RepID=UPI002875803A|nr:TetR-like C-terminal domain-containing protein [Clostridium sp. SHJSY1]MDS0528452.1 TetR family transcriptional regulator C-terminal domain-containing protein [Clostridium sp. SHJSY1]